MEKIEIPEFATKKERIDYVIQNKDSLIAQKKAITKHADGIGAAYSIITEKGGANKADEAADLVNRDEVKVKAIINTTNLMDSHSDVHMVGIWDKSLSENKGVMHLQEHVMKFDHIIADGEQLQAYVKNYTWKELGYEAEGETQALVFESTVKRSRNAFMMEQYAKGFVKNHSVGMRYVKLLLAVNDEEYGAEFEAWEKYLPQVANKEEAEKQGYFWVVKEAKVIEGSAVPRGSNWVTPTEEVKQSEPPESTRKEIEPPQGTQISVKEYLSQTKIF